MIGYSAGCSNPTVTDNYFVGEALFTACKRPCHDRQYFLRRPSHARDIQRHPHISQPFILPRKHLTECPTDESIRHRTAEPVPGWARNIAVYNWSLQDTVDVNVETVLNPGDHYEVRDAQD